MKRQIGVNGAICHDVDFVKPVLVLEYNLAFFKELLLQFVDECFERVRAQLLKVDNVLELRLEPQLVLVLVLHQAVVELLFYVGEDVEQLVEVLLAHHSYCRVILRLDRCCTL